MRKKVRAINLNRETLRHLEPKRLREIGGGFSLPPTQCGDSNDTCDNCPTYSCGLFRCL
jgi:hypothetical protein